MISIKSVIPEISSPFHQQKALNLSNSKANFYTVQESLKDPFINKNIQIDLGSLKEFMDLDDLQIH